LEFGALKIFKNESPKPQDPSFKSQAPNLEFGALKIFKNESPKSQDPSFKSQAPNLEFGIWSFILLLRYYRQALYSICYYSTTKVNINCFIVKLLIFDL